MAQKDGTHLHPGHRGHQRCPWATSPARTAAEVDEEAEEELRDEDGFTPVLPLTFAAFPTPKRRAAMGQVPAQPSPAPCPSRRARPARLDQRQEPVKKGNESGRQDALSWNGAARRRDIFSLQAFVEKSPELTIAFACPERDFPGPPRGASPPCHFLSSPVQGRDLSWPYLLFPGFPPGQEQKNSLLLPQDAFSPMPLGCFFFF